MSAVPNAPKLFGRPPSLVKDRQLCWDGRGWFVILARTPDASGQLRWSFCASHCGRVVVRCATLRLRGYVRRTDALRALERELTRLAAGLDAMGVPRG